MSAIDLFEPGSFHVDPLAMAEALRQYPSQNSGGVASSLVVKLTSGMLFGFTVSSVAAQFILLFDLAALPADGAVPTLSYPVGATSSLPLNFIPPRTFKNGIVLCNSTTQHTKTLGAANCIFDVQYL